MGRASSQQTSHFRLDFTAEFLEKRIGRRCEDDKDQSPRIKKEREGRTEQKKRMTAASKANKEIAVQEGVPLK